MTELQLTSPAFDDGAPIPREYGYTQRNVNPPLRFANVPDEAASLVLIIDDPDAVKPAGKVWNHWLVWNIPPDVEQLTEGWSASAAGAVEGQNSYGAHGYGGPNPPDRAHTYHFRLYALDRTLDLGAGATRGDVEDEALGHIVARTVLTGTYAP